MDEQFYIYDKDGMLLNTIVATEEFAKQYCEENGWTYKPVSLTLEPPPGTVADITELTEAIKILTGGRDDDLDAIISGDA